MLEFEQPRSDQIKSKNTSVRVEMSHKIKSEDIEYERNLIKPKYKTIRFQAVKFDKQQRISIKSSWNIFEFKQPRLMKFKCFKYISIQATKFSKIKLKNALSSQTWWDQLINSKNVWIWANKSN